jgi:plasmid stabilization system protein ParE
VRIRYTRPALVDLSSILDYIAEHSPQGVERVHRRIRTVIELLAQNPHIGVRTEDPTIRRLTTLPYQYLIFYEATEDGIVIHAVRHAARNPSTMPGSR